MWDFFKRWHPLILLLAGIYLAIPKPGPNPAEVDEAFLDEYDKNKDGVVDRDEFGGLDFELRDRNKDGVLTVGSRFRWPLHDYKWNLGQDLKGGSSLRYVLRQQDIVEAEKSIHELLAPLRDYQERVSPQGRTKFGRVIEGGEIRLGEWEEGDYQHLLIPGQFDEGRVDALKRFYKAWSEAKQRKEDKDLVGPTIETLNRRLGTSGITELNIAPLGDERLEVKLPEFSTGGETDRYKKLLETTGKLEMRVLAAEDGDFRNLEVGQLPRDEGYKFRWIELARSDAVSSSLVKERDGKKFVPVQVIDEYDITGKDLQNIQPSTDQQGRMAVSFELKGLAVARFEELTRKHREAGAGGEDPRLLAILIDEKVYSAYSIKDTISGAVQLSGNFNAKERDDIINVLKSGSLNVRLELEGEETVGPSEGAEAVRRGLYSLIAGALLVFAFALLVYRGLGVLTIVNLIIVVTLVMGAMSAGLGTLTMPGIAGLVLTIGMAIDANILINERIREEREKQLNMRGAVEEGFRNALSAIVDANVTTLLTAIILYKVGSGPIQGFALTLAIGIVATLYTALGAYRAMVFGILNVKRDAKFSMAGLAFARNRNIDWLKLMPVGALAAAVLVIGGGSFMFTHGGEVLGIEFRGGHTFRVQMKQGYERDEIAAQMIDESTGKAKFEWADSVEVQPIRRLGSDFAGGTADRFDFRFPMRPEWVNEEPEKVTEILRDHIEEVFGAYLVEDGWRARATGVTETTFEARFTLALKDAEKFRETWPDDYDKLWLTKDRSWGNDTNAARNKKGVWFGEVSPGDVDVTFTPNASGDRQRITVRATAVAVMGEDDRAKKHAAFEAAITKYFWGDSEFVSLDGKAAFDEFATRGNLLVNIVLLNPVVVSEFTELVNRTAATRSLDLNLRAVNADADKAKEFELTSAAMTFSSDPASDQHFSKIENDLSEAVSKWLKDQPGGNEISKRFLLSSAIGATVASESQWRALLAIVSALVIVVIYIRIRFASVAWGLAAVVALLHDSFVVIGLIGLADYLGADIKIDLTVVAAILTVIGYSLNDTIINFDRIRENLKNDRLATGGKTPLKQIINTSINQMLSRTVMTSGTTLLTTLCMLIFGGPLLKGFAFAMTAGIIVGTFSSIYIAGPILLYFDRRGKGDLLDMTEAESTELEKAAAKALAKDAEETEEPAMEEAAEGETPEAAQPEAEKPAEDKAADEKKDDSGKQE
ncbi:MAG: protein translocase subunit SecD [Planctomycetes bacterium]|nr:protein translocase subunit SecD [Planctomycetota bacterium]MCW8134541.1 protein translocase subunit SecD [Planctomycetota bacterium]